MKLYFAIFDRIYYACMHNYDEAKSAITGNTNRCVVRAFHQLQPDIHQCSKIIILDNIGQQYFLLKYNEEKGKCINNQKKYEKRQTKT